MAKKDKDKDKAVVKEKAIFISHIPEEETVEEQTDRLLNGNKYKGNDKDGRGQKLVEALKSVETLFGSNYALSDTASEKLIALLRSKADHWDTLKMGTKSEVGKITF